MLLQGPGIMDGMTPYHQNRLENGSFGTRIFPLLNDVTLDRSFKLCSSDTQPGLLGFFQMPVPLLMVLWFI